MSWIKNHHSKITSLILWDKNYEPYQTIILRHDNKNQIHLIYYFQLDDRVVAYRQTIQEFRTDTEEEKFFQIARIGLWLLEMALEFNPKNNGVIQEDPPIDKRLNDLLSEAFLSGLAIGMMRTKSPDFGFYSFSPNLKKLEKMIRGENYSLLAFIQRLKE